MEGLEQEAGVTVTVGMPVFNDVAFLRKSLDSILNQSFSDFELIISDDGSTDGSRDICLEYEARDERVKYVRQATNIGISRNMQFLLGLSKSKYFMWAADDDLWHPEFIARLIKALESDTSVATAFCPYICIDEKDDFLASFGIRSRDYGSKSRLARLVKFFYSDDDGCGYGLFRREKIKDVHFPVWWGVNKKTALNNIYPAIAHFLSVGNFILVGDEPLWFNRIKEKSHHPIPMKEAVILKNCAYSLRRLNVFLETLSSIYRGSKSVLLVLAASPFAFMRFVITILDPAIRRINNIFDKKQ